MYEYRLAFFNLSVVCFDVLIGITVIPFKSSGKFILMLRKVRKFNQIVFASCKNSILIRCLKSYKQFGFCCGVGEGRLKITIRA